MTKLQRILGIVFVVGVVSCVLPPRGEAAPLAWIVTDASVEPRLAMGVRLYEQTPTGVAIPTLTGLWTRVATVPRGADVRPGTPGLQLGATLADVTPGVHVYVCTAYNLAGETGPSNTLTIDMPAGVPANPVALIFGDIP
jgi:hypothetical protein